MTNHKPPAFGEQCEAKHDGWRAAFFCVVVVELNLHTHVCHLHRRLLVNQYPDANVAKNKCYHGAPHAHSTELSTNSQSASD